MGVESDLVDAHLHYWSPNPEAARYISAADKPISAEGFVELMDRSGVRAGVQVTRVFAVDDEESLAGARRFPDRFRVVGRAPAAAFTDASMLRRWWEPDLLVGIRIFSRPFDETLLEPSRAPFWSALARLDIPVSIYVPGRLGALRRLVEDHPGLRLVLDHAGGWLGDAVAPEDRMREWDTMLQLAEAPGVLVKASALPELTHERAPFPRAQELLAGLVEHWGTDRVMWGSNFTPAIAVGEYAEHADFARAATAHLSERDRHQVLAGVARATFWPSTPSDEEGHRA